MDRRNRIRGSLYALILSIGISACAGDAASNGEPVASPEDSTDAAVLPSAGPSSPVRLALADVPVESVNIADALLAEVRGSEMASGWTLNAELGDAVYQFHSPDVEGVAYYEFSVTEGGRILVATGRHDSPVPSFSDTGKPFGELLLERATELDVTQLQRLNPRDMVATNARGEVASHSLRPIVEPGLLVADYEMPKVEMDEIPAGSAQLQKSADDGDLTIDEEWDRLYPTRDKGIDPFKVTASFAGTDVKWLWHYKLLKDTIRWSQHDVDPSADGVCWAGCGPVAWAQVAAYLAFSERWGNPKYKGSNYTVFYPNISTVDGTTGVKGLVSDMHKALGSFCWPVTNLSAVLPQYMDDFLVWAKARKANQVNLVNKWVPTGDSTGAYNAIRKGDPVILGWSYNHYNIGVGAGSLNGARYVWVNNGQGVNYNGWMRLDGPFFTGIINSYVAGK